MARVSLVDRLLASTARIVAVAAPLGYGKTTLLAQWSARTPRRSAWISLDERDNDPGVLLHYVAAALDRVEPIDAALVRSPSSPADVDPAGILRHLLVTVGDMRKPFTLVLDRLEVIQDQRCCDAIAELALNVPRGSTLALASRTRPPIPIGKLRAEGVVVDVGVDDLAMERDEAAELVATARAAASRRESHGRRHREPSRTVNGFLEEAVDEAVGASSKKWALLLVAFVAVGAVVLWLVRRQGGPGLSDSERSGPAAEDRGALRTVSRFVPDRLRNG